MRSSVDLFMTISTIDRNNARGWWSWISCERVPWSTLRITTFLVLLISDILFLLLIFTIRNVNSNLCIFWFYPFKEQSKTNIVTIRGKLPVETLAISMGGHPDSHSFSVTNLDDGLALLLLDCVLELVNILPRPHLSFFRLATINFMIIQRHFTQRSFNSDFACFCFRQTRFMLMVIMRNLAIILRRSF